MRQLVIAGLVLLCAGSAAPTGAEVSAVLKSVVWQAKDGQPRTLIVYDGEADETLANEFSRIAFACNVTQTVSRQADGSVYRVELGIGLLTVEPFELSEMLRTAADLLPSELVARQSGNNFGLPIEALRLSTDAGDVEIESIDKVSMDYSYMFGFWAVTVTPSMKNLPAILTDATQLRISFLGQEETIRQPEVLAELQRFIYTCDP